MSELLYEPTIVTKEMAKEILEKRNSVNRKISQKTISAYSYEMNNDNWIANGQGEMISFNKGGNLINGQHRLSAFLTSNKESMEFTFVKNCPDEAFTKYDIDRKRTKSQLLGMCGCKDPAVVSQMISLIRLYKEDKKCTRLDALIPVAGVKYFGSDYVDYYQANKGLYDCITEHFKKFKKYNKQDKIPTAALCASAYILMDEDFGLNYSPEDIYGFLDALVMNDPERKYESISSAYCEIVSSSSSNVRRRAALAFELIAKAWNHRHDNGFGRITRSRGGKNAKQWVQFK